MSPYAARFAGEEFHHVTFPKDRKVYVGKVLISEERRFLVEAYCLSDEGLVVRAAMRGPLVNGTGGLPELGGYTADTYVFGHGVVSVNAEEIAEVPSHIQGRINGWPGLITRVQARLAGTGLTVRRGEGDRDDTLEASRSGAPLYETQAVAILEGGHIGWCGEQECGRELWDALVSEGFTLPPLNSGRHLRRPDTASPPAWPLRPS